MRLTLFVLGGLAPSLGLLPVSPPDSGAASDAPWEEILGASRARLPAPLPRVEWRADLRQALEEARAADRPLFVTLRCVPCKQCASFDQDVLEGGPELDPLLAQFVTVRLTTMRDVDRRLLPFEGFQDLDLSWWGYFLSPEGRTYGVYGGRDHVSDTTRISVASLQATLRRVLAHHHDPRRTAWNVDGEIPVLEDPAHTPVALAGWEAWTAHGAEEARPNECLHCHQVSEILRQPAIDAGSFDKRRDFDVWPFPENIGLELDRDHGLRVSAVVPGSPAAGAGLRPGDVLGAAAGRRLHGQADLRGVLHRAGRARSLALVWQRGDGVQRATLALRAGWRGTDPGWRKSVAEAALGAHPGFGWPLAVRPDEREALGIPPGTMAVRPYFGRKPEKGPAARAGLRGQDVITAVNGRSPDVADRPFMVWFRQHHEPGETIELTLIDRSGRMRTLSYELPD